MNSEVQRVFDSGWSFPVPEDECEFRIDATYAYGLVINVIHEDGEPIFSAAFSGKNLDKLAELVAEAQAKSRRA